MNECIDEGYKLDDATYTKVSLRSNRCAAYSALASEEKEALQKAKTTNANISSSNSEETIALHLTRALDDAEYVITTRPDWDKGYLRKGELKKRSSIPLLFLHTVLDISFQ